MKNRTYKYDLMVIICIILSVVVLLIVRPHTSSDYVLITKNKHEYGRYDLRIDQKIPIDDQNTLQIKNHKIKMIQATCPDKLCIKQGAISKKGQSIICLPHKLIIEVISGDEDQQDDKSY